MKQTNVIKFPLQPIEIDRLRLYRDEPCTILVLPKEMVAQPTRRFSADVFPLFGTYS
jgi:hypothetical protein